LLALGSACGGSDGGDENAEPGTPATTTDTKPETPPTTTEATESTRCENVPPRLVKTIEDGLNVSVAGTLKDARAVKSEDFKQVYFISAEIDGEGMEGAGEIATWAKSGPLRVGGGLIYAVDGFANQFSNSDDGGDTDAQLSMDDDGAEESRSCVEDAS
jgi:hypothetical protein